ncbi:MAG: hypothetical protein ACK5NE_06085 [Brachymonas sp.]
MKAALGSRFLAAGLLAAGFLDATMFHLPRKGISKIGNQFLNIRCCRPMAMLMEKSRPLQAVPQNRSLFCDVLPCQ